MPVRKTVAGKTAKLESKSFTSNVFETPRIREGTLINVEILLQRDYLYYGNQKVTSS